MGLRGRKLRGRKIGSQKPDQDGYRNRRFNILSSAIICVLIAGFSVVLLSRCSRSPTMTEDFEGVILDRWAGYIETDEGSRPYFRLLVEADGQHRLTVRVDADTYHRSQVGMKVSRRKGKIELAEARAKPGV